MSQELVPSHTEVPSKASAGKQRNRRRVWVGSKPSYFSSSWREQFAVKLRNPLPEMSQTHPHLRKMRKAGKSRPSPEIALPFWRGNFILLKNRRLGDLLTGASTPSVILFIHQTKLRNRGGDLF